jgi:hypothetical protein
MFEKMVDCLEGTSKSDGSQTSCTGKVKPGFKSGLLAQLQCRVYQVVSHCEYFSSEADEARPDARFAYFDRLGKRNTGDETDYFMMQPWHFKDGNLAA